MLKNKKIISFSLAMLIILILIPIAFAADEENMDVQTSIEEESEISSIEPDAPLKTTENIGTIYVSVNGNDSYSGTDDNEVKTISKAIELATKDENTDHKIIIKEGNYSEYNLEITSKLEIASQGTVIIDGNHKNTILTIETPEEVKITGITFKNGYDKAIMITDAKVTIDNCIFVNNTSDYGGAIFWNADNGILSNSYFTLNRARIGSAVLWGTNDEDDFKQRGKNGLIINSTFDNNDNANTNAGGCMGVAIFSDNVNITNCNFTNSIGKFDTTGGALLIQGKYVTVDNCLFENNTMDQAPAIQVYGDFAEIKNSQFINNTVSNEGRAGAIDIQSNNIKVYNNMFIENGGESCHNGGAITIYTFEDGVKNITENYFINNSANFGGAIFINGGSTSYVYDELIIVNNNVFDGNQAVTAAGIYIMNVTIDQSLVILKNNQFKNLEAIYSSAIHISSAEVEIANNTITNCVSLDGNNNIFNTDGYIDGNLSLKVGEQEYYGLYAGKTININVTVVDDMNNPISGGIIYLMVNGENIDDDGFSLESGVATVPFYSSVDGLYVISADYYNGEITKSRNCTVLAVPYIITINFNETKGVCKENVTVPVEVSVIIMDTEYIADDENLTITFNNEKFQVPLIDGFANINLTLPDTNGTYRLDVTYDIKTVSKDIIVKDNVVFLTVPELKVTPHAGTLDISLKDSFDTPLANETITLKINDDVKPVKTNDKGIASIDLDLDVGTYNVSAIFSNNKYKESIVNSTIIVDYLDTILTSSDINMKYGDKTTYVLRLTDDKYQALINQNINITLNGKTTQYTTDDNGIVTILIDLAPDTYKLTANYAGNEIYKKSSLTNTIIVTSQAKLTGTDLSLYFSDTGYYKVRLFDEDGNATSSGKIVKITINGKSKNIKTDANGYASFKISGLNPKTYKITASYNHLTTTNKIVVKKVLSAKNISKKKSKVINFKVKLAKGKKALANKKIKIKFKGKTYTKKTNKKGIATLKIKNLKVGKYKIYSSYLTSKIQNTIKIKK